MSSWKKINHMINSKQNPQEIQKVILDYPCKKCKKHTNDFKRKNTYNWNHNISTFVLDLQNSIQRQKNKELQYHFRRTRSYF